MYYCFHRGCLSYVLCNFRCVSSNVHIQRPYLRRRGRAYSSETHVLVVFSKRSVIPRARRYKYATTTTAAAPRSWERWNPPRATTSRSSHLTWAARFTNLHANDFLTSFRESRALPVNTLPFRNLYILVTHVIRVRVYTVSLCKQVR